MRSWGLWEPGGILFGADDVADPYRDRRRPGSGAAWSPEPAAWRHTDIHALMTGMAGNQIKALLLLDTNPLFTLPEGGKLRSAFGIVPFIASFASFLDESAVMADLILPNHMTLERWIDDVPEPGVGFSVRTLGQPAVEPRWDTRDPGTC